MDILKFPHRLLILIGSIFLIASCGFSGDMEDLREKMREIEQRPSGRIPAPPEFKAFETYTYQSTGLRSPFERPSQIVFETEVIQGKLVTPDFSRRKEILEKFSLDAMSFVGTLSKELEGGSEYAIVDDGNGSVHRVQIGDYLGQNHGKVVSINQRRVELLEIVPNGQLDDDGNKLWIERPRNLVLRAD